MTLPLFPDHSVLHHQNWKHWTNNQNIKDNYPAVRKKRFSKELEKSHCTKNLQQIWAPISIQNFIFLWAKFRTPIYHELYWGSTIKYWRNGNIPFVWLKNECPISSANLQSWVKKNTSSCWADQLHNQPHFSFLVPHLIFIQLLVSMDCKAPNCFAENGGTLFRTNIMIVLALPSWLFFFRPSSNVWMVSTLRYQFFCMQSLHIVYARSKSLPLQR